MIHHVARYVLPATYALLPDEMASEKASALLLAIGLQESGFKYRRQIGGPAHGFWQFETAGVFGVLTHHASSGPARELLEALRYPTVPATADLIHDAIADNDVLACGFARLLLWTLPEPLPGPDDPDQGWICYTRAWRPGKPRPATWADHFALAWSTQGAPE